ncbi:probable G-protein coupled receptor 160 isoform X2 [Bos javanicus]|uniref:probable G-protein coupled receptor 160 isoform X2 n=1 Tax=Bos javanicus TaxID=9906 RepID=UPI002AA7B340|nr:probable G-protein coupled receptor 160 isoform X2 [Bos javanicus]
MGAPWAGVGGSEGPALKRGSHLPPYTLGASPVPAPTPAPLPRGRGGWPRTPLAAPPAGGALWPVSRRGRDGACALEGWRPHFLVAGAERPQGYCRVQRSVLAVPTCPWSPGAGRGSCPDGDVVAGLVRRQRLGRRAGAGSRRASAYLHGVLVCQEQKIR